MVFYIEEEYGYRYWTWETGKTKKEMIDWWENLETVDPFFFDPGKTLPFGDVREVFLLPEECTRANRFIHLHTDEDSHMYVDGKILTHKGYNPLPT